MVGGFALLVSFFISILSGIFLTYVYLFIRLLLYSKRHLTEENPMVFAEMSGRDFLLVGLVTGVIIWLIWLGMGKIWNKVE